MTSTTLISEPLASLSLRVCIDGFHPDKIELPVPKRFIWAELDTELKDAELHIERGKLILHAFENGPPGIVGFAERLGCLNEPARLLLDNGTCVTTPFASLSRIGALKRTNGTVRSGARVEFMAWDWLPDDVTNLLFVGEMPDLSETPGDNLVLIYNSHNWSRGHFRAEGNFTWHIVVSGETHYALATARLAKPSCATMRNDVSALEFVAGESLNFDVAWAVDPSGKTVGAIGLGRLPKNTHRHRPPVPAGPHIRECWAAPLFRLLTDHISSGHTKINIAITGYIDGLRGHIHGSYLLGQVALEAICRIATPRSKVPPLVDSTKAWHAWVQRNSENIHALAATKEDGHVLMRKLNHNVIERPVGEVVERAYVHWGVSLPEHVLKEIARRSQAAHKFEMVDNIVGNLPAVAQRVDMIQMLLAGAIAKQVGFCGPIVGWERDDSGYLQVPQFWKWSAVEESTILFECRAAAPT